MPLPRGSTGSLGSAARHTESPRRDVRCAAPPLLGLSTSQSREHMPLRFQRVEIPPSSPLCAFVILEKAAAPAKLSTRQGPVPAMDTFRRRRPWNRQVTNLGEGRCYRDRLGPPRDKWAPFPRTREARRGPSQAHDASHAPGRSAPDYAMQRRDRNSVELESRFIGSSRPTSCEPHLHGSFNFTTYPLETVGHSLRDSCWTILSGQGISLP